MSSFVISKCDYIKAAGFFAGLAEQLNYYREPAIYWYSSKKQGLLNAEDYYNAFCSLYDMNARSVMLQYGDSKPESDDNEYRADFEKYRRISATLYRNQTALRKAVYDFLHFCDSVRYQIEDESLAKKVKNFTNACQHYLLKVLYDRENYKSTCWGSFDLEDTEPQTQTA